MSDSAPALQIDVVSDVVCPWCFVGKRQLEEAIDRYREAHPEAEFSIRWHPFQLNPDLPREGVNRSDYLRRKFGSDDTGALYERVRRAAGTVGLSLDMAAIVRQPNTLSAHALMEMAAAEACQDALAEALFAASFQQGRDLTEKPACRSRRSNRRSPMQRSLTRSRMPIGVPARPGSAVCPVSSSIAGSRSTARRAPPRYWRPSMRPVAPAERSAKPCAQPRPTKGIAVAITVMNSTLASSGRLAICRTASPTRRTSIRGSGRRLPSACRMPVLIRWVMSVAALPISIWPQAML
jgi:2-hydroxychromene-2-carboxylate isomerase